MVENGSGRTHGRAESGESSRADREQQRRRRRESLMRPRERGVGWSFFFARRAAARLWRLLSNHLAGICNAASARAG